MTTPIQRPIYVDASPLASGRLTGLGRYTARLALALAKRGEVRFFDGNRRVSPPASLDWSEDQDLAVWAGRIRKSKRSAFTPEPDSVGIHTCLRRPERRFGFEVSILHDLTPLIIPETHTRGVVAEFQAFFAHGLLASDAAVADSHSTRADAAWLCDFPESNIHVGHPGASLCVGRHLHASPVLRRPEVGVITATIEPRKNLPFLLEWFRTTQTLPPNAELWCVGSMGWKVSRGLLRAGKLPDGRRVRFLGAVDDRRLCEIYQTAGWMVYPSFYEGFGFPVLDALRHGVPVLAAGNSSLREFAGPGVGFFDPISLASVDRAFESLKAVEIGAPPPTAALDVRYSWDRLVDLLHDLANGTKSASTLPAGNRDAA